MNKDKISITINSKLFDEIANELGDDRVEAVEDFVAVVVQNYLDSSDSNNMTEDNIVEKRLKDLGYL
jgi:hypothetical protein